MHHHTEETRITGCSVCETPPCCVESNLDVECVFDGLGRTHREKLQDALANSLNLN